MRPDGIGGGEDDGVEGAARGGGVGGGSCSVESAASSAPGTSGCAPAWHARTTASTKAALCSAATPSPFPERS